MLRTKGKNIVNADGRTIVLKSIGIGGWMMMEGYMLGGKNIPEHVFKSNLKNKYGIKGLQEFETNFQRTFFSEEDVKKIKKLGFNCVRLPINYNLFNNQKGWQLLDEAVGWFNKHKIYVILDLHAAPGSQNPDWHSDSAGTALLWKNKKYADMTIAIWDKLSKRYKYEEHIAGYDILNEAVTDEPDKINDLYSKIISAIRGNLDEHILFIEPNFWAQDFKGIKKPSDKNFAWSVHFYKPIDFTFNWNPFLSCPKKEVLMKEAKKFKAIQDRDNVPMFVGEFGVASRCPVCHDELKWVKLTLDIFKKFGWSWSYWTYKSVAGALVPDGIYRTFDHEIFRRDSNTPGMENIIKVFGYAKKGLWSSLDTKNFRLHTRLYSILKKFLVVTIMLGGLSMATQAKTIDWKIDGCYTGAFIDWQTIKDGEPYQLTQKAIDRYTEMAGKKCAVITWYKAFQFNYKYYDFPRETYDLINKNGATMLLSWEPRDWDPNNEFNFEKSMLPDIIEGKHDTYILSWAEEIKKLNGPIILRFAPEMNIDNMGWSGAHSGGEKSGPQTYVEAFRHVHDLFKKAGVTNVIWCWTPINWGLPFEVWNHYSNYYPGNDYVDIVGVDEYNWGTSQKWSTWQEFKAIYWKFYSEITHLYPDKPLIISEFACSNVGGDKSAWIRDTFRDIKRDFPKIKAFVWFNKDNTGIEVNNMVENSNWALDSSAGDLDAMRKAMSDPYYLDTIKSVK
jgi:aryl-phospho-beta-D-glucosidase BglC (GH1 family)/beta-mannanase